MKALNRKEALVNAKANGTLDNFKPLTRDEAFTKKALELGGGGSAEYDMIITILDWNAEPGESCDTQADLGNLNNKIDNKERITVLIKYPLTGAVVETYYQYSTTAQVFATRQQGPDGKIIGLIEITDFYYYYDAKATSNNGIDRIWLQYTLDGDVLRQWGMESGTWHIS